MDHLQQDIDSLELERGALRDKLKLYGKKERPVGEAGSPAGEAERRGPSRGSAEGQEPLHEEVAVLRGQLERERGERRGLQRESFDAALRALTPLPPPQPEPDQALHQLRDKFAKFQFVSPSVMIPLVLNHVKKTLVFLIFSFIIHSIAQAQNTGPARESRNHQVQKMKLQVPCRQFFVL